MPDELKPKIAEWKEGSVYFSPPLERSRKNRATGQTYKTMVRKELEERVQVTDKPLGLHTGNGVEDPASGENPGIKVVSLDPAIPVVGGEQVDVDHNPYNFVALAGI